MEDYELVYMIRRHQKYGDWVFNWLSVDMADTLVYFRLSLK